jgi:AcrR family transcriptional regulator
MVAIEGGQRRRRRARNASEDILDAAQHVAARDGAARLTIEAVAREVGMTKGGVLYNFPSKAALLTGMLERMLATFAELLEGEIAARAGQPNPTLRAIVQAASHMERFDPELLMAILATAADNPGGLAPLRRFIEGYRQRVIAEAADPLLAQVLLAAFDGLKLQRMVGLPPTDPETRAAVLDRLRVLAETLEGKP